MLVSDFLVFIFILGPIKIFFLAKEAQASDTTGVFAALLEKVTLQTPEEAAKALLKLIDESTRNKDGGEFINVDGTKIQW